MAHQFWRAGGAAGVEIGSDVAAMNLALADEPVGRLLLDQVTERVDSVGGIAAAEHLHDRLEMFELWPDLLDLLPDVGARHRPKRHQDLGIRGLEDFSEL